MKKLLRFFFGIILLVILLNACEPLKPYERIYVNDPEMGMSSTSDEQFEYYVQSIREGSVTAAGKKGSGGCGCN